MYLPDLRQNGSIVLASLGAEVNTRARDLGTGPIDPEVGRRSREEALDVLVRPIGVALGPLQRDVAAAVEHYVSNF